MMGEGPFLLAKFLAVMAAPAAFAALAGNPSMAHLVEDHRLKDLPRYPSLSQSRVDPDGPRLRKVNAQLDRAAPRPATLSPSNRGAYPPLKIALVQTRKDFGQEIRRGKGWDRSGVLKGIKWQCKLLQGVGKLT